MYYHQLTSDERCTISALRMQGFTPSEIAEELGRDRSTVYRELGRNTCNDGRYRVSKAISRTRGRRSRSRRNSQFGHEGLKIIKRFLRKKWSPIQIAETLKKTKMLSISHETIYKYIWRDKSLGGKLYTHLRQSQKNCRKRYNANDSRGLLAGKRHISERSQAVEQRMRVGHWEIDTVMGSRDHHCILTLVERKTGFTLIGKLKNKTKKETNACLLRLIRSHRKKVKTITSDNGTEFHGYKDIEKKTGIKFYFATPYHSWERGTNENTNGLIRQYLPKRKSMASLTQKRCSRIAHQLNSRPRERHDFKTPLELYQKTKPVALQT